MNYSNQIITIFFYTVVIETYIHTHRWEDLDFSQTLNACERESVCVLLPADALATMQSRRSS